MALAIAGVFFGGLTAWALASNRDAAAMHAERALLALIDDAHLPEVQKASMRRDVELVLHRFEEGELGVSDLDAVASALAEVSLLRVSELDGLRRAVREMAGLSDADRAGGLAAIDRLAADALEGRASPERIDALLSGLAGAGARVGRPGGGGGVRGLRAGGGSRIVSEAELRELLAGVEAQAASLERAAGEALGHDAAAAFRGRIERILGEPARAAMDARARDVDSALEGLRSGR